MIKLKKINFKSSAGFTLIELLIVIAILGTLAVVVLIALNPLQQMARTRDSGRISTLSQLGHSMEAYATTHNGEYPTATGHTADWMTYYLQDSGELSTVPKTLNYSVGTASSCGGENGWCYTTYGDYALLYTTVEAASNINKCDGDGEGCVNTKNSTGNAAYFVYSTEDGRAGLYCSATAPTGTIAFCEK